MAKKGFEDKACNKCDGSGMEIIKEGEGCKGKDCCQHDICLTEGNEIIPCSRCGGYGQKLIEIEVSQ